MSDTTDPGSQGSLGVVHPQMAIAPATEQHLQHSISEYTYTSKLPGRLQVTLQHDVGCQIQFAKRHIEADTCVGTCASASFAAKGKLYEREAPGSP